MKYRVKFKCYWYNTGAADNHYYTNHEDFETLEAAEAFQARVDEQFSVADNWETKREFLKSGKAIDIENGFIASRAVIVKYFPEREEPLSFKPKE